MLPPLAQNTSTTPISEPPATTPDATGKVNSSASFGCHLSRRSRFQQRFPIDDWQLQASRQLRTRARACA
jgi:hypothetical protein